LQDERVLRAPGTDANGRKGAAGGVYCTAKNVLRWLQYDNQCGPRVDPSIPAGEVTGCSILELTVIQSWSYL